VYPVSVRVFYQINTLYVPLLGLESLKQLSRQFLTLGDLFNPIPSARLAFLCISNAVKHFLLYKGLCNICIRRDRY
jgi:hypothetical protein